MQCLKQTSIGIFLGEVGELASALTEKPTPSLTPVVVCEYLDSQASLQYFSQAADG
jgi:hypothetical protein